MKNILFFSIIVLFTFFSPAVYAQDAVSTPVVNNLTQKIKNSSGIRADFIMSYFDAKGAKKNSVAGKLKIKGDSYAVDMKTHQIFCDGKEVINYLVSNKEVQLSANNSKDLLSPSQLFSGELKTNFSYKHFSTTMFSGKKVNVIEFTPKVKNRSFSKMHLFVDMNNIILGGKLFDNKGGYYYYTLNNINMNSNLKAADFTLNYKALNGVEVIDLR